MLRTVAAKNNVIHSNQKNKPPTNATEAGGTVTEPPNRIELLFASFLSDHCLTSYSLHATPSTPHINNAARAARGGGTTPVVH